MWKFVSVEAQKKIVVSGSGYQQALSRSGRKDSFLLWNLYPNSFSLAEVYLHLFVGFWVFIFPLQKLFLPLLLFLIDGACWYVFSFHYREYGELCVCCGLIGEAVKIFEDLELWDNLIFCYRCEATYRKTQFYFYVLFLIFMFHFQIELSEMSY